MELELNSCILPFSDCLKGTYGQDCEGQCGQCKEDECNHIDGSCESGCLDGYQGDICVQSKSVLFHYTSICTSSLL